MSNKKKAASTPNGGDGLNTSGKDIIKAIRTQIILLNYPTQYDEIWVNVKTNRICLIKWDVFGMGRGCAVIKSVPEITTAQGAETVAQIRLEFGADMLYYIDTDFKKYFHTRCIERRGCYGCLN